MRLLCYAASLLFWFSLSADPAHARKFKDTPLPKNLTYAEGEHCGANLNRGFDMTGCKSRYSYLKIVGPKYKKDYDTSGSTYSGAVSKRIVKKAHKLKNGARVEAGDELVGLTLVLMGEVRDKSNKKYKRRKRIASEWLITPEWSEIVAWRSDFALVKKPGTQDWYRMSLPDGKQSPWHRGDLMMARGFDLQITKSDKQRNRPVFLIQQDSADTLSARIVDTEGNLGPSVDRIVKFEDMPEGRMPLETFTDRTILAHRLDENGKVFDQVFVTGFDRALTPPMAPLITVVLRNTQDETKNRRAPLVEIDPAKGLYWPVTTGVSVLSKPKDLLGMRPFRKGADRNLSPIGARFSSAGKDGAFKSCDARTPECPFDSFWISVWNEAGVLTFSPTGSYIPYRFPSLEALTQRNDGFMFTEIRPVDVPEKLKKTGMHYFNFDPEMNRFGAGRNLQGQYEAFGWYSGYGEEVNLRTFSASPRTSFQLAASDVKLYEQFIINRKKQWAEAEKARQLAFEEDLRRRQEEVRRRKLAAQNRARQNMKQALAAGQYAQALDYSIYADARAVGDTAVAAIRAGYGYLVSDAELYTAVRALPGNLRGTVQREMDERRDASRAAAQRAQVVPSTGYSSSSSSKTKRYKNPASISRATDYEWKSKLNYLKGNTSQYKCGSSSFCN